MKRFFLLIFALAALVAPALAQNDAVNGFCTLGASKALVSGLQSSNFQQGIIPKCTITVYLTGTTNTATIFTNASGGTLSNPFTSTSPSGQWLLYAATGLHVDVVMSGGVAPNTYPTAVTLTDVVVGGGGSGGGGATLPSNALVFGLTPLTSRAAVLGDYVSLTGAIWSGSPCTVPTNVLQVNGQCGPGGSGGATINATPQNTLLLQPNAGTIANVGGPATTSTNAVAAILNGVKDAAQFQTTPTSNNGLANILATPNTYANAGPAYPNVEAPTELGPFWRVPLVFFNAEFLWSQAPPYAPNTFFNDQRFGVNSSLGTYAYNPTGNFGSGVTIPTIYDRITHDQESVQPGHGQVWVGHQHDQSFTGSGINQSGVWDSRTGEQWNFISTRRGISNPLVFETQCNGDGDCHALQNDILCPGNNSTGADEGCTLYRNQMIENQVVWTAISPSNQATGATQILGNYIDSSGLAGEGLPLIDSTQASAKCLITAANSSPSFTVAGNIVSTCTYTPDNIGHLVTDLEGSTGIVPPKYNGVTTTVTGVVVNGLSSPLVAGQSCWADAERIESAQITSVGALSGGSQTVTVSLRYPHLVLAYVVQGPNNCKYVEAMANRKNNGNAPLRDWARIIGATDAHTLLYAAIGAGRYQPWPQGSFTTAAFGPLTITRDGTGHASFTSSGAFSQTFNHSLININSAVDTSYNRIAQITQTGFGSVTFTWADSGPVGSTTTTGNTALMTNFGNFSSTPGIESSAYIMFPGCEVVYTGNLSTHVMDGSNLCEYNNMTVASGDTLEVMHGNEIITNLEHNLITTWMPSSSSIASATKEEVLTGVVRAGYTWNRIQIGLDRGESQFFSAGGTMNPSANWTTIFGDRMWNTFLTTPAPSAGDNSGNLWLVTTCPLAGCTAQQDPYGLIHISSPHSNALFSYSEWNSTFGWAIDNLNFMTMNTNGFNYQANDGAGSNYIHNLGLSGSTLEIGNAAGAAIQVNYTASSGLVQISDGVGNISNFTQTSTKFGMDKPLTITGTADGCATFITGVLSSTGVACGSSGGIILTTTGTSGPATLTGTTLNIPVYTTSGGGVTTYNTRSGAVVPVSGDYSFSLISGSLGNTQGPSGLTGILLDTAGTLSVAVAANFPTLNQSTTGSAATLTTPRTIAGTSFNGSANVSLANKFIVQGTTDAGLSGAQFLGALGTCLLKNTTTTGVLSCGAAGTDYLAINGSSAALSVATSAAFGVVKPDNTTITITAGVISAVGGGSGTVTTSGSPTTNTLSKFCGPTVICNSGLTDDGTKLTYTGSGTANGWLIPEGTAITGVALSAALYPDSTLHRWMQNPNNIGPLMIPGIATAGTSGHLAVLAANGIDIVDGGAVPAGTVTAVSIVTANGISGSSSGGATPALTLALGAITPTSTNGVSAATMAFNDATSSIQGQLNAKAPIASPTFTGTVTIPSGAVLNTPASGVATNLTGLPISTGVSGLATGAATFLGTATSANLRALITDESGTGAALFAGGNIGAATGTSLLVTGNIDGTAPLTITTGTTATLGGTFKSGYTLNQNATAATAVAYTLPTAAAGLQYCVGNSWNGTAATTGVLTLNSSATGQFIIFTDGTLSATGGNVTSGGAAADAACVVGVDATHWQLFVQRGTWTKH